MIKKPQLIIYTDGGARGNPGPAAVGIVIYNERGKLLKKLEKFLGPKTNNEAEYEAVIEALKQAHKLGADRVEINLDSELLARQLNNIYKVKNHRMQGLVSQVRNLETRFKRVSVRHIPRSKNELADRLVNEALDAQASHHQDR